MADLAAYKDFIPIVADCSAIESIKGEMKKSVDVFIHLAWSGISSNAFKSSQLESEIHNIENSLRVIEFAKSVGVGKFVFVSSNYEFMEADSNPCINPNTYGLSKQFARRLCESYAAGNSLPMVSAFLANTYGVGDVSGKAVNFFIRKLLTGQSLDLVLGNRRSDWMYIGETVRGLAYVADFCIKPTYIGHKEISTFQQKLETMKAVLGSSSELRFGKFQDKANVNYESLEEMTIDQKAIECISFEESIKRTAEWNRQFI